MYVGTVLENYNTEMEVDGQSYDVHISDTSGTEEHDRLRPLSYPQTDVVLLCFSIDSPDSLDDVEEKVSA